MGPRAPAPRAGGVAGTAAWLVRAAVGAPRGRPGDAPGASRACGAAGAAAQLAWAAVTASRGRLGYAPGASQACGAAGAVASAGASSGSGPGSGSRWATWGCAGGGSARTPASARRHSSRSAGVSPSHFGETGEREQHRQWRRPTRWGKPSESDILAAQSGRCMACVASCASLAVPPALRCVGGAPWVVLCGFGNWGGGSWSPVRVLSPMGSTCTKSSVDFKLNLDHKFSRFSTNMVAVATRLISTPSTLSEGSGLPTLDSGESNRGLASSSMKILPVAAPTGSIDGHVVGTMHSSSKPEADLMLGTNMYGVERASGTSTLPELGRWALDNIELLPTNMYSFPSTRHPSMSDLSTPTFHWWLIEPQFSCRSVLSTARSAGTILGTTSSGTRRVPCRCGTSTTPVDSKLRICFHFTGMPTGNPFQSCQWPDWPSRAC